MSEVVALNVEVERSHPEDEDRWVIDYYSDVMGYAHFLGELIIYDLDGMDHYRYPESAVSSVFAWEVYSDD